MAAVCRRATRSDALVVRVRSARPLRYERGADASVDRPAHVRSASALVSLARHHVVVQDDALFLAKLSASGVGALTLPSADGVRQFDEGRGNKAAKPDLEAGCLWGSSDEPTLVAFGSGSTAARERLLVAPLHGDGLGVPRWIDGAGLYAALREAAGDAQLNIEGAFRSVHGDLCLLQRGNGRGGWNACLVVERAWLDGALRGRKGAARLRHVVTWDLGTLGGVPLGFTDGLATRSGQWLFAASAEASPDAYDDGPVFGSAVGWADDEGGHWAPLVDAAGDDVPCKLEGLARGPGGSLWGVTDADDPDHASELLELVLEGPWPPPAVIA